MRLGRKFCQKYTKNSKEVTENRNYYKNKQKPQNITADALHISKCPKLYYISV